MYAAITGFLSKFIKKKYIFKYGFNISPMYRRSTGRVIFISDDLQETIVKIPLSYKNKNYVGSIFGGSLFAATDPIFMIQFINILGKEYVVWDKAASIKFKRPASENTYASFIISNEELEKIKEDVDRLKEIDLQKKVLLTNKDESVVFAEVEKTIYIANKAFYKEKQAARKPKK